MVDVADAAVVAILTRAPGHGGKSRLFAELHTAPDPALLTALLLDTLDGTAVAGMTRVVAVEPADACDEVRALLPSDVLVVPQRGATLGDRMRSTMAQLFDRGARAVILVGSDLPDIDRREVARACALIDADSDLLVLGPAEDGGYYLIGAAGKVPAVFDGIAWGTPLVLAQTLEAAAAHQLRVALVGRLPDVDTVDDLRRVKAARTKAWVAAQERQE